VPTLVSDGETLFSQANEAVSDSGPGRLFMRFVLPAQRNVRKVGGRGAKAFWVFDANYDWHWADTEPQPRPISDFDLEPYGEWRLELEPADLELNHNFLTVLEPTGTNKVGMFPTTLLQTPGMAGVHIADPALGRVVLFSEATNAVPPSGPVTYSFTGAASVLNTIFDLAPGSRYSLKTSRLGDVGTVALTPDANGTMQVSSQGVLTFLMEHRPRLEAPSLLADGRLIFRIEGPTGSSCVVQTATTLAGTWTNVVTFTNTVFPVTFTNALPADESQRYFRLLLPGL
jgi:hypothetical protein